MDVRIKVLKTEFYEDIADEYLSRRRKGGWSVSDSGGRGYISL